MCNSIKATPIYRGGFIFLPLHYSFPYYRKGDFTMNDFLRKECKLLKALQNISYKELSEYLEIKTDSFYCWLKGYYDLSYQKQKQLHEIINTLKE